jgi:hypothetical protein
MSTITKSQIPEQVIEENLSPFASPHK